MFTKEYWNNRAKELGHTGYSDPFLYCFDQQARLYAVEQIIREINSTKNTALDFGCGSGDFIELLSKHYENIYGFDISETVINQAKKRINKKNIYLTANFDEVPQKGSCDLIITVTVLQALSSEELMNSVSLLADFLSTRGKMICMEFFTTPEYNRKSKQTKSTTGDWKNSLTKNDLKVVAVRSFYNPVEFPSKSWITYKSSFILRGMKLLKHQLFIQKHLTRTAKRLIKEYDDVIVKTQNTYTIYIIEKRSR